MGKEGIAKGLKDMRTGAALFLILSAVEVLNYIILLTMVRSIDSLGDVLFLGIFSLFMGLASLVLVIVALVFVGKGIFELRRGSVGSGKPQRSNMDWAMRCFFIYIAIFLVSFFLGFIGYGFLTDPEYIALRASILMLISGTLGWVSRIAIVLVFFLPLKDLARERQRELSYVFAGGTLLIALVYHLIQTILFFTGSDILTLIFGDVVFGTLVQVLYLGLSAVIFVAYRDTYRLVSGDRAEDVKIVSLRRAPIPYYEKFDRESSRPLRFILFFLIVGFVLSGFMSIGYYMGTGKSFVSSVDNGGDSGEIIIREPETEIEVWTDSGMLGEGQMDEYNIDMGAYPVLDIQIRLTWTDESDLRLYRNTPDEFTLYTEMTEDPFDPWEQEENGENEQGGVGELFIRYTADESDPFKVEAFVIYVTLENAGDYDPVIGPGIIKRTDNSNDYDIEVRIEYVMEQEQQDQQFLHFPDPRSGSIV